MTSQSLRCMPVTWAIQLKLRFLGPTLKDSDLGEAYEHAFLIGFQKLLLLLAHGLKQYV